METGYRKPYLTAEAPGRYRQQELWSGGTNTLSDCTSAYVEWNSGAADKYLQPGQRLKMVVDVTEQSG